MKLLFLGGKMHMKMLHGVKASLTKGMAMKGGFYEAVGWIGEIIVMGRTEDIKQPHFADWKSEAARQLSDPDLFKGPRAQGGKRKKPAHKSDRSVWGKL